MGGKIHSCCLKTNFIHTFAKVKFKGIKSETPSVCIKCCDELYTIDECVWYMALRHGVEANKHPTQGRGAKTLINMTLQQIKRSTIAIVSPVRSSRFQPCFPLVTGSERATAQMWLTEVYPM